MSSQEGAASRLAGGVGLRKKVLVVKRKEEQTHVVKKEKTRRMW